MPTKPYKVYLAGPDVFYPNAKEIGIYKKKVCQEHGFEGLYPLDNEITGAVSKYDLGRKIYQANMGLIDSCDFVAANFEAFRGPSADVGTVFEAAYAKGCGKPVYVYNRPAGYYKDRVIGKLPHDGLVVEDFGSFDNLMLAHGFIIPSGNFGGLTGSFEHLMMWLKNTNNPRGSEDSDFLTHVG